MTSWLLMAISFIFGSVSVAIVKLLMRKPRRGTVIVPNVFGEVECRQMACHEAGHAVVAYYAEESCVPVLVSIRPSSSAFGHMETAPRTVHNETYKSIVSAIAVALAGRLAEEKFLGVISSSCVHDLQAATHFASEAVLRFGMGMTTGLLQPEEILKAVGGLSDGLRMRLEADVEALIQAGREQAEQLLETHSSAVRQTTAALLEKQTLTRNDLEDIFHQIEETHPTA